jgi:hypothetical protein
MRHVCLIMFCGTLAVAINGDRFVVSAKGAWTVLALAGALSFLLSLIWSLFEVDTGDKITATFWMVLGLLLVALHLGGVGSRRL